jgi:dTDP-D-glucose 4,6-dehydratase
MAAKRWNLIDAAEQVAVNSINDPQHFLSTNCKNVEICLDCVKLQQSLKHLTAFVV